MARPRSKNHLIRRWGSRAILYGAAIFVGIPMAFCHVLTHVPRLQVAAPPAGWTEAWIVSRDGLRLRMWHKAAHRDRPAVLVVHGLGDSLESYLDQGAHFAREGYGVALLDLRAHGGSAGRVTTLGGLEREDVRAGLSWLVRTDWSRHGVILVGHSMGAVASLRAAVGRPEVRAVIVEAPFDTYRSSIRHHARLYYHLPDWVPLTAIAIRFAAWRAAFDPDEVDAVAAARELRAPLLAIVDGADPRMPEQVVRRVYDAHPGPKQLWIAPDAPHVGAILSDEYWPTVTAFLERHADTPD